MSRVRSSMVLLGVCVVALSIGALQLATQRSPMPIGSSYSTEPSGAQALFEWTAVLGANPSRLSEAVVDDANPPASLLVLQPESPIDPTARQAFDAVPAHGGTLIVAGDSFAWLLYTRQQLGITVEPTSTGGTNLSTPDPDLTIPVRARYQVRADDATPLLVDVAGDWVALRKPYHQGWLIVIASPEPLLNQALRDDDAARFVYRTLLSSPATLAFDEAHHSFSPPNARAAPATVNQLLLSTAPGRAVVFAAVVTFLFVALTGRRLGPALVARGPRETRRTMYEHVQMLANLYRRAGQFGVVRSAFARHYRRSLARGGSASAADAVARIETARNESELIAALAARSDT